ncbi:MAG: hypothetical protein RIS54_798 [Verrucomicrobiota bacterium]|jgi:hypothetical protein
MASPGNGVAGHGFVKAHEDSISESRPPFPLFVDEIQPPPAQYGRESYTTRPPWMASDQALINGQSLTATYAVDGASLAPFPLAPAPTGDTDKTAIYEPGYVGAATHGSGTAPAYEPVGMPIPRRRSMGVGLFALLFALTAKAVPFLVVLGAGYYTYSYFFGPPPMVEAMRRRLGGEAAPTEEEKPKSRAAQMMQQTRDVVSANDSRINFANALADEGVDLNKLAAPGEDGGPATADPTAALSRAIAAAKAEAEGGVAADAPAPTSKRARAARESGPIYDVSQVIPGRLSLPSPVEPSVAFIVWVDRTRIAGTRAGTSTKVLINDLTVQPGDLLDHSLGIVFESLDAEASVLRFRDKNGAIIGKRF